MTLDEICLEAIYQSCFKILGFEDEKVQKTFRGNIKNLIGYGVYLGFPK